MNKGNIREWKGIKDEYGQYKRMERNE